MYRRSPYLERHNHALYELIETNATNL